MLTFLLRRLAWLGILVTTGCTQTVAGTADDDSGVEGSDTPTTDGEDNCNPGSRGCGCLEASCHGGLSCVDDTCEQSSDASDDADDFSPSDETCAGDDEAEYQVGELTSACYRFVGTGTSWGIAKAECGAWGGSLVNVLTEADQAEVVSVLSAHPDHGAVWLGLSSTAVGWRWTTGESLGRTSWGQTEPDQEQVDQCGYAFRQSGYDWHDQRCDRPYAYLCRR